MTLAEALRSREIEAAGLDVFENEAQAHPALLDQPNVVLIPHLGTATSKSRLWRALRGIDNLFAAHHGTRPPDILYWEGLRSQP